MNRLILIFALLIVAAAFTINAFWLQLNGESTIEIINHLPLLIAPANYVYTIWIIIFIFLFLWCYNYKKNRESKNFITPTQTLFFICTMIFQIASLYYWHQELFVVSLVLILLQLLSLLVLYLTYPLRKEVLHLRIPIAIYLSWTTFLFILSSCYILVFDEWHGFGLSNALWAVIVMTIGTAIALHLRYHHFDIAYPLVFVWIYIGIVFANGLDELLVTTAALFLCGVMIVGIFFMKKNPARLR